MDVDYSAGSPGHHAVGASSVIVSTEQAAAKQLHYKSAVNQQQTKTCKLAAMSQFLINRAAANNAEKLSPSEEFSERNRWVNQGSERRGDEEGSERRDDHEESESIGSRVPNAGLEDSQEESREEESLDTGDTNEEISGSTSSAKGMKFIK